MMNNCIKYLIAVMGLCLAAGSVQAALSPSALVTRDLDTMVEFVRAHPKVAGSLQLIDFVSYTVVFGEGCKARFVRKKSSVWTFSRPGPQPNIQFDSSTCPLKYETKVQD